MIAAVADNGAIGVRGEMPWHIGEDLKYFKRVTMGCPVIMGRATFESLGRPLPGRTNIVMSHSRKDFPEGVVRVQSSGEALHEAEKVLTAGGDGCAAEQEGKCFVIGGGKVYSQMIEKADRLYLTRVHVTVEDADAFFPPVDMAVWLEESCSETLTDCKSGIRFEFAVYKRRR
ncbi:MAG TPA: dihydrofolate reductase [Candidatus Cryptobacteroides excrementigallinarum]|nr:dihydrofolate reductase [Candidatus Cryptobacteroides excrementigallinarum]